MWPNNLTYTSVIVSPNCTEETSKTTLNTSKFELLEDVSCMFSDYILIFLVRPQSFVALGTVQYIISSSAYPL